MNKLGKITATALVAALIISGVAGCASNVSAAPSPTPTVIIGGGIEALAASNSGSHPVFDDVNGKTFVLWDGIEAKVKNLSEKDKAAVIWNSMDASFYLDVPDKYFSNVHDWVATISNEVLSDPKYATTSFSDRGKPGQVVVTSGNWPPYFEAVNPGTADVNFRNTKTGDEINFHIKVG